MMSELNIPLLKCKIIIKSLTIVIVQKSSGVQYCAEHCAMYIYIYMYIYTQCYSATLDNVIGPFYSFWSFDYWLLPLIFFFALPRSLTCRICFFEGVLEGFLNLINGNVCSP